MQELRELLRAVSVRPVRQPLDGLQFDYRMDTTPEARVPTGSTRAPRRGTLSACSPPAATAAPSPVVLSPDNKRLKAVTTPGPAGFLEAQGTTEHQLQINDSLSVKNVTAFRKSKVIALDHHGSQRPAVHRRRRRAVCGLRPPQQTPRFASCLRPRGAIIGHTPPARSARGQYFAAMKATATASVQEAPDPGNLQLPTSSP